MYGACPTPIRAVFGFSWGSNAKSKQALHCHDLHSFCKQLTHVLSCALTSRAEYSALHKETCIVLWGDINHGVSRNRLSRSRSHRHDHWKRALHSISARAGYNERTEPSYKSVHVAVTGRWGSCADSKTDTKKKGTATTTEHSIKEESVHHRQHTQPGRATARKNGVYNHDSAQEPGSVPSGS
jgi:hypothetical protein